MIKKKFFSAQNMAFRQAWKILGSESTAVGVAAGVGFYSFYTDSSFNKNKTNFGLFFIGGVGSTFYGGGSLLVHSMLPAGAAPIIPIVLVGHGAHLVYKNLVKPSQ